jgi:hypothetical protein
MDKKSINKMLTYLIVLFLEHFRLFLMFFITLAFSPWSLKQRVWTLNVVDVIDVIDVIDVADVTDVTDVIGVTDAIDVVDAVYRKSSDLILVF